MDYNKSSECVKTLTTENLAYIAAVYGIEDYFEAESQMEVGEIEILKNGSAKVPLRIDGFLFSLTIELGGRVKD